MYRSLHNSVRTKIMEYGYSMKNNHNEYYSTVILKNVCFFSNQYFIFPLIVPNLDVCII